MLEFLDAAKQWSGSTTACWPPGSSALSPEAVRRTWWPKCFGRLDRGGREPVGRLITAVAALLVATLASATIASMPFANTGGTRTDNRFAGRAGRFVLTQIASALHPADYAYLSTILIFAIGAGLWAEGRRRQTEGTRWGIRRHHDC